MTDVYDLPTEPKTTASSGRRSRRISADLWVRVGGVEAALRRRRGDLCATGIYVAMNDAVGCPGDVVLLSLSSLDKSLGVQTLARIARVIRQDDRARGARVIGAAFEFLPLDKQQPEVVELLHHVAGWELKNFGLLRFDDAVPAQLGTPAGEVWCELRSLGLEQLTLSSPTPFPIGTDVRIEVAGDFSFAPLQGNVISVSREAFSDPDRFALLVRLDERGPEAQDQYESLVRHLMVPEELKKRRGAYYDFGGQLGRLPLSEIVGLLSRERYSGVLSAGSEQQFFSFDVKDGEIVRCESAQGLDREQALQRVLSLKEGEFKFRSRRPPQLEALARPTARLMQDVLNLGNRA